MNKRIVEIAGWIGVVLVLGSYALLSLGVIAGNSLLYHALILFGSLGLTLISYYKHAYQPMFLNAVFTILATFAILRLLFCIKIVFSLKLCLNNSVQKHTHVKKRLLRITLS